MTGSIVLITGATGHIGFRALLIALEAGYHVRAAVRSQAKADFLLARPSIKALQPGSRLSFVIVPDILVDGAYDEAVKGVQYIIHLASPITGGLPPEKAEELFIRPAVKGTTNMLTAAHKASPGVKRVVITSSIVAIMTWNDFALQETGKVYADTDRVPFPPGPYQNEFEAYCASKVAALLATDEFVEREKPAFDVVNVMPGFTLGADELVTDPADFLRGTNGAAFAQVLGAKSDMPNPGATVHVDDTARAHVLALDPSVEGNQSFLTMSNPPTGTTWGDAVDIVARDFPDAVAKGILPNNGSQPTKRVLCDSSRTEKVLGLKFKGYEEQITSLTQHYLELKAKA